MFYFYPQALNSSRPCFLPFSIGLAVWLSVILLRIMVLHAQNKIERIKKGTIL